MDRFLNKPNLPQLSVRVAAVSEAAPALHDALKRRGIRVLPVQAAAQMAPPVASHADMHLLMLDGQTALVSPHQPRLADDLRQLGITVLVGQALGEVYPTDVPYNVAIIGNYYICNVHTISETAHRWLTAHVLQPIHTRQGYSKCSVCVVSPNAIITADCSIAGAARAAGLDVLQIRAGHIRIPVYDTGFIGGCCGKLAPDQMGFCGDVDTHPDAAAIRNFLQQHGVQTICLCDGPLTDIGGIIPVMVSADKTSS